MGVHSSNDDDLRTSNTKNGVCEERADNAAKVVLCHDDVAVLGDEDHLRYHAVMYLKDTPRPPLSRRRTNFTFREPG